MGINPNIIVLRCDEPQEDTIFQKIVLFCNVKPDCVIENITLSNLYEAPLMLEQSHFSQVVCRELGLQIPEPDLREWTEMVQRINGARSHCVEIGLVGKYVGLHDEYLSVAEALHHAGFYHNVHVEIRWIDSEEIREENAEEMLSGLDGILVPGGFGSRGIEGMILAAWYARENNMDVKTIALQTSADVYPMTDKVIGFGAFGVYEKDETSKEDSRERLEGILHANQEALLRVAAQSVISGFERGRALRVRETRYPEELREKGATFVNIYYNGVLRGSAGSTEPVRSILEDVAENAYAAAFSDFRFVTLSEDEIKNAEISVSFLTYPEPVRFEDEKDLLTRITPQEDGLILKERANRALFLPQIWETFSSPHEFLVHLKQRAGLPADYWSPTVKVYRFKVIDINSGDLENPKSIWSPR